MADQPVRGGVEIRHAEELSYDEFLKEYMEPLRPVLIRGVACQWRATRDWVLSDGSINLNFLAQRFGDSQVSVTDTSTSQGYGEAHTEVMALRDYVAWWHDKHKDKETLYYVKDWHFVAEYPEYQAYSCPPYFSDDWLNDWYDSLHNKEVSAEQADSAVTRDYRFVYMGPAGTSTPLHHDVLMSHSWSINISGIKRWILVPPSHVSQLYSNSGPRELAPSILKQQDAANLPRFPGLATAKTSSIEIIQSPGDALFVPSGWFHEVENVTDALSINHNWLNASCMPILWSYLHREAAMAEELIEDCRALCSQPGEFEGLVAQNVAANAGLNWNDVRQMLVHAASHDDDNRLARDCRRLGGSIPESRKMESREAARCWLQRLDEEQVRTSAV